MNALRVLRHAAGLRQRELAQLLDVPLETLRTWDSGRRPVPSKILARATESVARERRRSQLLTLSDLARELNVHVRTLQAAARTGRLATEFSVRSVFGRPMRYATRSAGQQFLATHYRRFGGQPACPDPLVHVPSDYDQQLRRARRKLCLTQAALAERIGAAGKAVVYQWESRKRTPSPVLWQRFLEVSR